MVDTVINVIIGGSGKGGSTSVLLGLGAMKKCGINSVESIVFLMVCEDPVEHCLVHVF